METAVEQRRPHEGGLATMEQLPPSCISREILHHAWRSHMQHREIKKCKPVWTVWTVQLCGVWTVQLSTFVLGLGRPNMGHLGLFGAVLSRFALPSPKPQCRLFKGQTPEFRRIVGSFGSPHKTKLGPNLPVI